MYLLRSQRPIDLYDKFPYYGKKRFVWLDSRDCVRNDFFFAARFPDLEPAVKKLSRIYGSHEWVIVESSDPFGDPIFSGSLLTNNVN